MLVLLSTIDVFRGIRDTPPKSACRSRYHTSLTLRNPPPNRINDPGTNILDDKPSERPDLDYESDPANYAAGYEQGAINDELRHESDAEGISDTTPSAAAKQTYYYPDVGEAIGDVEGYEEEHLNLCQDAWAPFTCAEGFQLASWFIESKVTKLQVNNYFSNGLGNPASVGYSSMHTLENPLRSLDPYGQCLRWFEGQVLYDQRTLRLFYRDILGCVRYLLRQITYRDDLVYAPRQESDQNGQRIYAEMHTAKW